jgi:SAM-dependent methyltransferase
VAAEAAENATPAELTRQALYADYVAHKDWTHPPQETAYTEEMFERSGLSPGARILELGFGQGALLDWAQDRGYETHGLEIIPELVERATVRHAVRLGTIFDLDAAKASFDGVFAVDVFEHIPLPELRKTLRLIAEILRPGGICVARFPNGSSPFWGPHMFSDATHTTFLTEGTIRQLIVGSSLEVIGAFNPRPRGVHLRQRLAYVGRDIVETIIGYLYFGHRFAMDPNVIVVLRRSAHLDPDSLHPPSDGAGASGGPG